MKGVKASLVHCCNLNARSWQKAGIQLIFAQQMKPHY